MPIFADLNLEKRIWFNGIKYVCGIDEVGRGPLAGPVVVGAVVFDPNHEVIAGIRDSKTLSEKQRTKLEPLIKERALAWGIGIVEPADIDNVGISEAVRLAMIQAVKEVEKRLKHKVEYLIIDGNNVREVPGYEQLRIKKGDMLHYSIASASILAKQVRDRIMIDADKLYPEYDFANNVGYGTKKHLEALNKYGACPVHRFSYAPVQRAQKNNRYFT